MLPVGHAAVGMLTYAAVQLPRDWTDYSAGGIVAALLGSQVPDVVDKPLAYYQLLPSGRSLGHSLVILLVVGLLLYRLTPDEYRQSALAVWVAAVSHPLVDALHPVLWQGRATLPGYLLWPVTRAPRYGEQAAPWVRVVQIYAHPELSVQTLVLVTCAGALVSGRIAVEVAAGSVEWWHPLRE